MKSRHFLLVAFAYLPVLIVVAGILRWLLLGTLPIIWLFLGIWQWRINRF